MQSATWKLKVNVTQKEISRETDSEQTMNGTAASNVEERTIDTVSMAEWLMAWDTPGHVEAMEGGGREFEPRPGHYSRMSY